MSAQEPPALPLGVVALFVGQQGSVWVMMADDAPHDPAALWYDDQAARWRPQNLGDAFFTARQWALSLRSRVADLERDLAEYRAADRAGKETM